MNKVCICGRLTRDPEVRYSAGENTMCIARFTLAVNRRGKKEEGKTAADFISCVAFGKTGETVEKYFKKGMKADLSGRIQTGSYKDKDGKTVYTTEVVVEDIEFGESKKSETKEEPKEEFMEVEDDTDLPFN
jgi:single-strand DNA-binding protein